MVGSKIEEGDTVYVTLEKEGEYWGAVGASTEMPETSKCIKVEVESVIGDSVRMSYGIENFFVDPGKHAG